MTTRRSVMIAVALALGILVPAGSCLGQSPAPSSAADAAASDTPAAAALLKQRAAALAGARTASSPDGDPRRWLPHVNVGA